MGGNPIQYQFKDGSNAYYIIIYPIRQTVVITNIEVLDGGSYTAMIKNSAELEIVVAHPAQSLT